MKNEMNPGSDDQKEIIDWKYQDLRFHAECDCTTQTAQGIGIAKAYISWFNDKLVEDTLTIITFGKDNLDLSGNLKLFPDVQLIGLEGDFRFSTTSKTFELAGDAKVSLVGIAMAKGIVQFGTNNFALHGELITGDKVTFIFSVKDKDIILVGRTVPNTSNGGPFTDIDIVVKIGENKGETTMNFKFCSIMSFKSHFDFTSKVGCKGQASLSMSDIEIFKGNLEVVEDPSGIGSYRLYGNVFIFPETSIFQFSIGADGKITSAGLMLTGSNTFGYPELIRLFTSVTINNGLPSLTSKVTVLNVNYTATSGLYPDKGELAFCLWYTLPAVWFFNWFVLIPETTYYFMVTKNTLYGPWFIKPTGWPVSADTMVENEPTLPPIHLQKEQIPTTEDCLAYIDKLLSSDYSTPNTGDIDSGQIIRMLYGIKLEHTTDENSNLIEVTVLKTKALEHIDDNVFNALSQQMPQYANVDQLVFTNSNGALHVVVKSQENFLKEISLKSALNFLVTLDESQQ
jgi:hypothetical protein